VTLKVRRYDFTTLTRSLTLPQPVDDPRQIAEVARRLLGAVDRSGGLRLLGVGVSGLSPYAQGDLFAEAQEPAEVTEEPVQPVPGDPAPGPAVVAWYPGQDVVHPELGSGWVWGSGLNRVTVRFEGPRTTPGPVRTLAADDPDLQPGDPPEWTTP
jgi:DNA polymerase-4